MTESPHSLRRLQALTQDFGATIKREFAGEIDRDAQAFKTTALRLLRRELPPRRGRPNDPQIDAAVRLVQQGKTIKDVLRVQVPGFDKLDTYGRYLADKGLRAAIARRRKRTRGTPPHN